MKLEHNKYREEIKEKILFLVKEKYKNNILNISEISETIGEDYLTVKDILWELSYKDKIKCDVPMIITQRVEDL